MYMKRIFVIMVNGTPKAFGMIKDIADELGVNRRTIDRATFPADINGTIVHKCMYQPLVRNKRGYNGK